MDIRSNQAFCVEWAAGQQRGSRILDYGCGGGQIVAALIERNIDAFGCDVYYEGGDTSAAVARDLFTRGIVRRMDSASIPFEDETFDLIISNTVLEHVESLEATLTELARVLKPGGKVLSLFPQREVWFEWHVGLPFIHWFPSSSQGRLAYAAVLRSLGFGFFKGDKPVVAWSRDSLEWIDRWTHYRSKADIERAFARHFAQVSRLEADWLDHKFNHAALVRHLPAWCKQSAVTLLAGLVFECTKPGRAEPAKPQPSPSTLA